MRPPEFKVLRYLPTARIVEGELRGARLHWPLALTLFSDFPWIART
jgi:hypothetical protein